MEETTVQRKLNKLIQQELSHLLQRQHVYVPNVMLTVSSVRITADLSLTKVYISVFPDQKMEEVVSALNSNAWEVRKSLASRIRNKVRKIPELRFFEDDSFKEADRIGKLLDDLTTDSPQDTEKDS